MPEQEVRIRFSQEGADLVTRALQGIKDEHIKLQDLFKKTPKPVWASELASQGLKASDVFKKMQVTGQESTKGLGGSFGSLMNVLKSAQGSFMQSGGAAGGFGGALTSLSGVLRVAMSPVTLLATGVGVLTKQFLDSANAAVQVVQQIRQLQAMSGLGASKAEDLKGAFELAGVSGDQLGLALFRLSSEIEMGGQGLARLGLSIRDNQGQLKSEGQLLLEVRDAISSLGSTAERNAALVDFFGRAGRGLAPAFALGREEFSALEATSAKYGAVNEQLIESTRTYEKLLKELAQQQERVNMRMAETIGLPFAEWWARAKKSVREYVEYTVLPVDLLRQVTGWAEVDKSRAAAAQAEKLAQEATKRVKKTTDDKGRATQHEVEVRAQQLRLDFEANSKSLAAQTDYNAQRLKMETGSDSEALRERRETNLEMVRMTQQLYDDLLKQEKRRSPLGMVPAEVELKLRKERDDKIFALEQENLKNTLTARQASYEDTRRGFDLQSAQNKNAADQQLTFLNTARERELAVNNIRVQDTVSRTIQQGGIEERYARETGSRRVRQIDEEITGWRELAARYPEIYAIQRESQQKILELGTQRYQAEQDINNKVLESRRQLVEQLQGLAEQEAGSGEAIFNQAAARLKAKGKKKISPADVERESAKMRSEQTQALGEFSMGGRVNVEVLSQAYGNRAMWKQMAGLATTPGAALGQLTAQSLAAAEGRPGMFMPTAAARMGFGPEQVMGRVAAAAGISPGGAPAARAEEIQKAFTQLEASVDKTMNNFREKLDVTLPALFDGFADKLIRELELQATRT